MPTNFANGITSYGMPVFPVNFPFLNAQSAAAAVGSGQPIKGSSNVYFVSSVLGADGNPGNKMAPGGPLATLKTALTMVSPGDTIVLMPGHVETMVAAGSISVACANITIVGLGVGAVRPTFKYSTATTATFDIVKDNITFANVRWDMTGIASLVKGINVKTAANDVTFESCEFIQASATNACATAILTDASANNLRINNCRFTITGAGTAVTNALNIVGGDGLQVTNTWFNAGYATGSGAIQNVTTACTNALVQNCYVNNLTASCTKAMIFVSTSTGLIANTRMQILSGTAPITGAALSWVGGNYYAATIATAGTLI
jgi:hypothetical protein